MSSLLLRGGSVLTPAGQRQADVLVVDGVVEAVGAGVAAADVIECEGAWVGPGFVDLHTHLREPGQEHKETIESGSTAAAAGGYTAVLAMPNTAPAIDTRERAEWVLARGRDVGLVEVGVAGAVTRDRAGRELADLDGMLEAGIRWFSDDGDSVATAGLLRTALMRVADHGGVVSEHAEDASLTVDAVMHEGEVSALLGLRGMPAVAETLIIARDVELAEETGGAVHIQHLSTAGSVALVRAAKHRGLRVTAEATPHHLTFDHTELKARDPRFKMKPPLRSGEDVAALRAAVRDGTVDIIATDHAPHSAEETIGAGFEMGAFGVIGLETSAAAVNSVLGFGAATLFARMSLTPARLGGFADQGRLIEPGITANLTVFDPHAEWVPSEFRSRSQNSPFIGRPLRGRVRATIFRGSVTFRGEGP
jgi:dihydroorotase